MPQVLTALALVLGLPLFLRMPPWADLTLYDVAARNLLRGGVHYRDVFDTNLPGFVWLLTAFRAIAGPSVVLVRGLDAFVFATVVFLADRLAKRGGGTPAARWWGIAGVAFLYPFVTEAVHAQRDVWMAVPALAAVLLRARRQARPAFTASFREGLLWGCGVWIKPHVALIATAVWLLTAWRVAATAERPRRTLVRDLLGNVLGGSLVGSLGVLWLAATGTWPHFWEVLTVWNQGYGELVWRELGMRVDQQLHWFPPWSLWLLPTIPLALLTILDGFRSAPVARFLPAWLWNRGAADPRFARAILASVWLVWAGQAFFVQRGFQYVHVTETVLMFALWATQRYALGLIVLLWVAFSSSVWLAADRDPHVMDAVLTFATPDMEREHYLIRHPLADPERMQWWPMCWRLDLTPTEKARLRDGLRYVHGHEASIGWEELEEVAAFLRTKDVQDYEVVGWHDSPHAVYLLLGIRPGIRFMHVQTAQMIGEAAIRRTQDELEAAVPRLRYAISDLERPALGRTGDARTMCLEPPAGATDLLPPRLPPEHRRVFPYNQPAIFRSGGGVGRYIVHEIKPPVGSGRIP